MRALTKTHASRLISIAAMFGIAALSSGCGDDFPTLQPNVQLIQACVKVFKGTGADRQRIDVGVVTLKPPYFTTAYQQPLPLTADTIELELGAKESCASIQVGGYGITADKVDEHIQDVGATFTSQLENDYVAEVTKGWETEFDDTNGKYTAYAELTIRKVNNGEPEALAQILRPMLKKSKAYIVDPVARSLSGAKGNFPQSESEPSNSSKAGAAITI
jgi:hypothetical protein